MEIKSLDIAIADGNNYDQRSSIRSVVVVCSVKGCCFVAGDGTSPVSVTSIRYICTLYIYILYMVLALRCKRAQLPVPSM